MAVMTAMYGMDAPLLCHLAANRSGDGSAYRIRRPRTSLKIAATSA
jgi:hypothetical protein